MRLPRSERGRLQILRKMLEKDDNIHIIAYLID